MPRVSFRNMQVGATYSRPQLAKLWGYRGYQALARGVVTPKGHGVIVLFVTAEQQPALEQYTNRLVGDCLSWEGPRDHFAERRMMSAELAGEEIHVFFRDRHHSDFRYLGEAHIKSSAIRTDKPSSFTFALPDRELLY